MRLVEFTSEEFPIAARKPYIELFDVGRSPDTDIFGHRRPDVLRRSCTVRTELEADK